MYGVVIYYTNVLAKFVLDALTGVLYRDDDQVVKLSLWKLLDTKRPCNGRTLITFNDAEVEEMPYLGYWGVGGEGIL